MRQDNKDILLRLLRQHKELGISDQIDFDKFYLYSIIVHSTAIEGSTVTEVEAQLLFDEGITSSKRTIQEQQMNIDLKVAYDYGREWIKLHDPITVAWLIQLASKVMAQTGTEYNAMGGSFSAAKGELRKLNVTAGLGGKSYMSYLKVPARLAAFCDELNERRKAIDPADVAAVYDLSFWAHYELVTIHPWADGNGRTSRLLMNLLQWEFGVLPTRVLKEDKAEYIQALIDTRESEDLGIFLDCMARHHCRHLKADIEQYVRSMSEDENVLENSGRKDTELTDRQKEILKLFVETGELNVLENVLENVKETSLSLGNKLGVDARTIRRDLAVLQSLGYLRHIGPDKGGRWQILNIDHLRSPVRDERWHNKRKPRKPRKTSKK